MVLDTKCGSGNCWLGIYTLYYIYVGDMNTLYKSILRNPTRGGDEATARLYVGTRFVGLGLLRVYIYYM